MPNKDVVLKTLSFAKKLNLSKVYFINNAPQSFSVTFGVHFITLALFT